MKKLIIAVIGASAFYATGLVTAHKHLFPYDQLLKLRADMHDHVATSVQSNVTAIPESKPEPAPEIPRYPFNQHFELFQPKSRVVMIGDSITRSALWNEIFPGVAIANRGVNGDTLAGILGRLDPIYAVKPKKAFIMAGVNDIYFDVPQDETFSNYVLLIEQLRRNRITVYIQSTLECSKKICGDKLIRIRELNARLNDYAKANNIKFIDINDGLTTTQEGLKSDYTLDGLHLVPKGYLVWSRKIRPFIY